MDSNFQISGLLEMLSQGKNIFKIIAFKVAKLEKNQANNMQLSVKIDWLIYRKSQFIRDQNLWQKRVKNECKAFLK